MKFPPQHLLAGKPRRNPVVRGQFVSCNFAREVASSQSHTTYDNYMVRTYTHSTEDHLHAHKSNKSQTAEEESKADNNSTHYLLNQSPNRKMLAAAGLRSATRVVLSRSPAAAAAAMAVGNGTPQRRVLRRGYHENIIEHYENPRNVGSLDKNDDDVGTVSGNICIHFGCFGWGGER